MRIILRLAAFAVLFAPLASYSLVTDAELQGKYGDKVLTLRQFYSGDHLRFDVTGKLLGTNPTGPWTTDGKIRLKEIKFGDGELHIRGRRQFLFYDPQQKALRDVRSITKRDSAHKLFATNTLGEWLKDEHDVEIEIECGQSPESADAAYALNQVFLSEDEPLKNVLPDFWVEWTPGGQVTLLPLRPGERAYRVGPGISAPHPTYTPDPEYSDVARKAGYRNALVLLILIVDEWGLPTHIRIMKPAGLGLDEKAVNAVRTWKFEPAISNGSPVPVQLNVEVTFKLY
jgi:TonB family protein